MQLLTTSTINVVGAVPDTLPVRVRPLPNAPSGHFWSCFPARLLSHQGSWHPSRAISWEMHAGSSEKEQCKTSVITQFNEKRQSLFQVEFQGAYCLSSPQPKQRPPGLVSTEIAPGALAAVLFLCWAGIQRWGWEFHCPKGYTVFRACAVGKALWATSAASELGRDYCAPAITYLGNLSGKQEREGDVFVFCI